MELGERTRAVGCQLILGALFGWAVCVSMKLFRSAFAAKWHLVHRFITLPRISAIAAVLILLGAPALIRRGRQIDWRYFVLLSPAVAITSLIVTATFSLIYLFRGSYWAIAAIAPFVAGASVSIADAALSTGAHRDAPRDSIGRDAVIEELVSRIKDENPVIALTGGLGDGKTWTLKALESRLAEAGQHIVVYISAWLPSEPAQIIRTCTKSIVLAINKAWPLSGVGLPLRRYAQLIVKSAPGPFSKLADFIADESQAEEIEHLKSSIATLPRRTVVLLDEIDRMEMDELFALLKYIRGIDEIPNITFVCALNLASVAEQVRKAGFSSRDYLEKFFPTQITLPTVDSEVLSSHFDARFEKLSQRIPILATASTNEQILERFTPLWRKHVWKYVSNLRKIDLLFASLTAAFDAVSAEVNPCDLLLLETLRYISPESYEFASLNRGYLSYSEWSWSHYDLVDINDERRQAERRELLKDFTDHSSASDSASLSILEELFPVISSKTDWRRGSHDQAEARRMKRIFHPSFTSIYFNRLPPPGRLSGAKQQEILQFLLGGNEEEAVRKFGIELEKLSSPQMRIDLIEALVEIAETLSATMMIAVSRFLYGRQLEFSGFTVLGPTEWNLTRKLVFDTAAKAEAPDRSGQAVLIEAIEASENAAFAAEILFYSLSGNRRAASLQGVSISDEDLKQQFANRFRREFVDQRRTNLMSMSRGEALQILYRLVSCGPAAKELAEGYLEERFLTSPASTSKFLDWTKDSDTDEPWQQVRIFIDEAKMCRIVENHLDPGVILQDSDRAILNDYLVSRCRKSDGHQAKDSGSPEY